MCSRWEYSFSISVILFSLMAISVSRQESLFSPERKFFVGGNLKMNGNKSLITHLIHHFSASAANNDSYSATIEVVIAPPSCYLDFVRQRLHPSIGVAAQNFHPKSDGDIGGAYTGEISAAMIGDLGVDWVIVGHSERRRLFCESDPDVVGEKALHALRSGLNVIFCVGETAEERQAGHTQQVIERQLSAMLRGQGRGNESVTATIDWPHRLVIAYEPVWAIGPGKGAATPAQAQETHSWVRQAVARLTASTELGRLIRLIYGGSVNAENSPELAALPDVDGFLVGRASLKASEFEAILHSRRSDMR